MNAEQTSLDALIDTFAADWLRLPEPGLASRLVADPLLVLAPDGTMPVPLPAFLAAIAARSAAVDAAMDATTTLTGVSAQALGDRLVLATISWSFGHGGTTTTLVSDFLLERRPGGLRCAAYLPRTSVLDQLD
ncbi:MAG TPA: hypothetical protein VGK18_16590 [Propionicimonas sp.]|uniref:hypothetical protein n=1 Tax=Propionicimonas sp. TaxID=1955623 RepID=UPI002F42F7F3